MQGEENGETELLSQPELLNCATSFHKLSEEVYFWSSSLHRWRKKHQGQKGKFIFANTCLLADTSLCLAGYPRLLGHSYPHAFYCLCGYFSSSNFYSLPELLLDVNSSSGSILHVMGIFSYFLCFNIQELTAYFQGSLYMFKRHYTFLNLFSFVSYINSIASGLFFIFDQSGQSVTGYLFPTNA